MDQQIEAVAKAIWGADHRSPAPSWEALTHGEKSMYRRMATCAVHSLQLREERRIDIPGRRGINPVRRLVSPWVVVEEPR